MIAELILPISVVVAATVTARIRAKIQSPSPVAFQCIPPKLCPVVYEQVIGDIEKLDRAEKPAARRLRLQSLWEDFRLNWFYLCEQANNTSLFLCALLFEKLRIPKTKSGMKYDDHDVLLLQLIPEAIELRWKQVRCQMFLVMRFLAGATVNTAVLKALLDQYKSLEEQIDNLAGMTDLDLQMKLRDALGLSWGMIDGGGNSGPEIA